MGGGRGKSSRKNAKTAHTTGVDDLPTPNVDGLIAVDPRRIRFQYSKIRPHFSGCGRSVVSTLDSIRNGELSPSDLPPIQVLVGPVDETDGRRWYFSLNNRRLWVYKRCAEEGLLGDTNGKIWVRVREPKSQKERERYSIENCAVEAKFMREKKADAAAKNNETKIDETARRKSKEREDRLPEKKDTYNEGGSSQSEADDVNTESSEDEHVGKKAANRFAFIGDHESSSSDDDDDVDKEANLHVAKHKS